MSFIMMKKLLLFVTFTAFVLCLPLQCIHAMERGLEDEDTKIILKKQDERNLEEIVISVPDEIWADYLIPLYCDFKKNRFSSLKKVLPYYSHAALVSKKWNKLVTTQFLEGIAFHKFFSNLFISNHSLDIFTLDLSENNEIIDEELKNLNNLTYLNLGINGYITDEGIKNLTNLRELDLLNNSIITINGFIGLTGLTSLDLSESHDSGFGYKGIEKLINLTKLHLSPSFTDSELKNLTYLTDLDLNDNEIITNHGIKEVTKLIKLYLGMSQLITDETLQHFTHLTYLNVGCNQSITDEGIKDLINLKALDLCNNARITGSGFKKLVNITSIDSEPNDGVSPPLTNEGINYLKNLAYLELRYVNTIGDDAIRGLTNLTYLNLDYHISLTVAGVKDLPNLQPQIQEGLEEIKDLRNRAYAAYNGENQLRTRGFTGGIASYVGQQLILNFKNYGKTVELLLELKVKYKHHLNDEDRRVFDIAAREQQTLLHAMYKEFFK
jgi:hypothetical protein